MAAVVNLTRVVGVNVCNAHIMGEFHVLLRTKFDLRSVVCSSSQLSMVMVPE